LDDDLFDGLQAVYERDGILPSEQVRRAVRKWLEAKGVMAETTSSATTKRKKTGSKT
jgi:hypothetical protein